MSSSNGRRVVVPLTNKSGGGVIAGDVVIIDTSNNEAFTTTTSGQYAGVIGVVQETIANNAVGRVLTAGYAALVNVPASVTRGHYVETHTVAKQATGNSARRIGSFGQFLTGGTTPTATLFGITDQSTTGGTFDVDTHLPWRTEVVPVAGMSVNTGFTLGNISEDEWADWGMLSTAQNDEIGCNVILAAGTWSVFLMYFRHANAGIATVSLDGSSVGTIDTYGTSLASQVGSITGIAVAATGKKALKFKGATKNGSSGGYALWISLIVLVRTA